MKCGLRGQNSGSGHAHPVQAHGLAADDGDVAVRAFVAGVFSGGGRGRHVQPGICFGEWPVFRAGACQCIQPDVAAHVAPMSHEQAGLGGQKGEGDIGMNHEARRRRAAHDLA